MIRPIQYLRAIAALMVVWHHSVGQIPETLEFIRLPLWGVYGVDLFFMISGFIMLVTTWDKPIAPMEFMEHRIKRIVPLYWAATLLIVVIAVISPNIFKNFKFDTASVFKSLFFIPYNSLAEPGYTYPLVVQGWTLNFEMFFYALFAATLLLRKGWRVPVMVSTLVVLVASGFIFHPTSLALQVYTNYRLLEFGAGMTMGWLWVVKPHPRRDDRYPLLSALGDASYSIYLSHKFTLGALRVAWIHIVPSATMTSSIILMAVSLAVSAGVGLLCYRFVERPLTKWISKRRLVVRIEVPAEGA